VSATGRTDDSLDAITDALLVVSRVLVAVSARSIADIDDTLTISQFRSLVVLANVGPLSINTLARLLGMQTSPTRQILEGLVTAGLVVRQTGSGSHRHEVVNVSARCRKVVNAVTARRRDAIAEIVSMMTPDHRDHLVRALTAFAEASGQLAFDVDDLL
jgi:DNA-binding MarR family transcriptional regulator